MAVTTAAPAKQQPKLDFLLGTRLVWRKIAQITVTPGLAAPTLKIPKTGYIGVMRHRIAGTVTVSAAGTAGTPNLQNIIASSVLSLSGNYQYRNIDGEQHWLKNNLEFAGSNDPVSSSPAYLAYNPTSATQQNISLPLRDSIALNDRENLDQFLLAAQARNYDITYDVTYGSLASIAANTETFSASNLVHYIEGLYLLDPDYSKFMTPDLSTVQQLLKDSSFTNVVVGDNVVPVTPINGPQLIGLGVQCKYNNVIDLPGVNSHTTNFRLRVNNGQDLYDIPAQDLAAENYERYHRALPFGYYYFDFLDDQGGVNEVTNGPQGPFFERALSTATLSALELIVTVASGTTTTNSMIKLFKRYRNPAIQ